MKVLHLVTSLDFGGLERRMEILSRHPSERNSMIFCALGAGGTTYRRIKESNSNVYCLNQSVKIFNVATLTSLIRFVLKVKPVVVHTHGCEANFYGVIAARLCSVKLIVSEEIGIPGLSRKSTFIFKLVYILTDKVIPMSDVVEDYLVSSGLCSSKKIHQVYNPVLMSEKVKDKGDSCPVVKFIYMGRLEDVKNPLGLARAFRMLLDDGVEAKLSILGDGSQYEQLSEFCDDNELNGNVTLLGFCANPLDVAINHDVLIQPSHTEGFSLALAEAMSCGIPVISTPVGSAADLVFHGENGWLLKDSSDAELLRGLHIAVNEKDSLPKMGRLAAKAVRGKHSAEKYAAKLDEFYERSM